jgi:pilus assembly protein CpaC
MKRTLAAVLLVVMVLPPQASAGQAAARAVNAVGDVRVEQIDLMVGRSTVIRTDYPITRVALSTPEIADAMVTTPYELLVHGKTPGTISLLVWGNNGSMKTYDVAVRRDLSALDAQIQRLFPGENITVSSNGKDVVLSGVVSTKYIVDRASSLAVGYVEKADNVVNLIRQQEGVATNQVMLRVRFAEVSRSAMQELGGSFFTGADGKGDWIGRSSTQQFAAPEFDQDKGLVFSDFLNLFLFNTEEQLGAVVKALKGKGLFQSLAEPNLITQDGKEASFLAGGEYPYPVLQGSGSNSGVTIVFKEFGVRLRFTPTVMADDMIQLKVAPEVSSLDFGNAVVLQGFRVPALATRRTETSVELRDGQTFAIAGMLDQNLNESLRRVPGIGDIPILGYLFRSQAYQKNATELVVMITPHIVRRGSPGVTPNLPGLVEPFLPANPRPIAPPPPAFMNAPVVSAPVSTPGAAAKLATAPEAVTPGVSAPAQVAADAAPGAVQQPRNTADQRKAAELMRRNEANRVEEERKLAELERTQGQIAARQVEARARQAQVLSRQEEVRAAAAAKVEARADAKRQAQELKDLTRARKVEAAQQEIERALAEKRAEEQAVVDRKRYLAQQAEAVRVKAAADKLAKEQEIDRKAEEKLAKEQADRQAELARLVEQYKKLTADSR